jgi:hypothetical protein
VTFAHMKTSTRRWLGAALIGSACVTPLVLAWAGFGQGRMLESHTISGDSVAVTAAVYEMHWPVWATLLFPLVAGVGLLLLVLPRREKPVN